MAGAQFHYSSGWHPPHGDRHRPLDGYHRHSDHHSLRTDDRRLLGGRGACRCRRSVWNARWVVGHWAVERWVVEHLTLERSAVGRSTLERLAVGRSTLERLAVGRLAVGRSTLERLA